jgi:Tfp pilus assembly protein PilX
MDLVLVVALVVVVAVALLGVTGLRIDPAPTATKVSEVSLARDTP